MIIYRLTTIPLLASFIVTNAETIQRKDQRIFGGSPAPAGRFPFFAQYEREQNIGLCGASLIHSDIVLGAAGCCVPEECGLLFDSIDLGLGTAATVEKFILHPQFDFETLEQEYNVMIMKLTTPIDITPIGYNTQSAVPAENQALTVIGFGADAYGVASSGLSEDLLQVTLNYVPNEECEQAYQYVMYGPVRDDMICAAAGGKGICYGDYGGPLLTADDGTGEIAGIASSHLYCSTRYPGLYTRVSTYQEWIQEAICCMSDDPPDSCTTNDCSAEFGIVSDCNTTGTLCYEEDEADFNFDNDWWCSSIYSDCYPLIESISDTTSDPCLSPDATAMVEKKGKTSIKDVAVGDRVMTASEKYQTVFTISHSHPDQLTSFLSVQTEMGENPLELTPLHMLFLQGKQDPIPAKDVKIGDVVQTLHHGPQKVTNVTVVTRHGFYNPVTMDGTIVVDGIIASTYTSLNGRSYLEIAGREWISFQLLFDIIASPFRAFCTTVSLDFCAQYQPSAVHSMVQFYEFWSKQNNVGQVLLFFAFVSFFGLARIMLSPAGILVIMVFIGVIYHSLSTRISALHKKKIQEKKN